MPTAKTNVTPMMAQFLEIKAEYRDAILFYRMGDFYEMFFDDAVAASEALDIALTKRGKHEGKDIAMCGVPVRSAEGYLHRLIAKGFRVAVCDQMENPTEAKKRGYKSVVRREVVRLVTAGTLVEDSLLEARRHNFLCAYSDVRGDGALAWVDISTGAFHVAPMPYVRLAPELARLSPSEVIIVDNSDSDLAELVSDCGATSALLGRAAFDSSSGEQRLISLFDVGTLDAFGTFSRAELSALGAIVEYLEITQKGNLPMLRPPVREQPGQVMQIDASTRRNLELTHALSGGRTGSLIATIDRTVTSGGGRLLERRLSSPSRTLNTIQERHDAVTFIVENATIGSDFRELLRRVPDLERALSRLGLDRSGPRDLAAIRGGLAQASAIAAQCASLKLPKLLKSATKELCGHEELIEFLEEALIAEPALLVRDGGFISQGYDKELDEVRLLRDEGRSVIAKMQADYASMTGVSTLKIKHNNVLGYFIDVTAPHADKLRTQELSEIFKHRQTTANQVRFTTVELSEMETRILNAEGRALEIEKVLYGILKSAVLKMSGKIYNAAHALAEIDITTSLADIANGENWCRPQVDNSRKFLITGGRHPVVEAALRQSGTPFIANDCDLADGNTGADIWLLTGPNMAGKSTFLRQNAIIALLAQIGSYVPATKAEIGIVSQLFSRVGASDDLARGRSTFMVEMVETAAILNQADDQALVILDEIGRGTATYDGLSIAWASMEHLHDINGCRALFATHYHEMTSLSGKLDGVENATVTVKEFDGDVIFLHEVKRGAADRSYGVQVAKLAGLPESVVARAKVVLEALEKGEREGGSKQNTLIDDLPLFAAMPTPKNTKPKQSAVEERLGNTFPDDTSAREALAILYDLKEILANKD